MTRRISHHIAAMALCMAALLMSTACAPLRAQAVGILPVYDSSLESIGPQFTEQSTLMLLQDLEARSISATLLNPGGVYLTTDTDLIQGYGAQSNTRFVLVTSLGQVERPPRGKKGDWFLVMQAGLLTVNSGGMIDLGTFREKVKPEELTVEMWHGHFWGTSGSRPFNKQPLGRLAEKLVNQVLSAVLANPSFASGSGLASAHPTPQATCPGTFRVSYPRGNRVSKSYDLLLDGSDESVKVDDGIAPILLTPGEHLVLLHIADPPYKVPVQHQYAFNFFQDCSKPNVIAVLDEGGGMLLKSE